MEEQQLNPITLLPKSKPDADNAAKLSLERVPLLILLYITFVSLSIINDLANLFYDMSADYPIRNGLIRLMADLCRFVYYAIALVVGRKSRKAQALITHTFPIVYSIILTESYILCGTKEAAISR